MDTVRTQSGRDTAELGGFEPDSRVASTRLGRRVLFWVLVICVSAVAGLAVTRAELPLIIGAIVAGVMVFVIARNPYVGLLVYLTIFSLRLAELIPALAPLRSERLVGLFTFGLLVLAQVRSTGGISFDRSRQSLHFYGLIAAAFISVPLAVVRSQAIDGSMNFLKLLILYLLVVQLVDTQKRLRTFVVLYCLFLMFVATDSVVNYIHGAILHSQGIARAIGTTSIASGPNELGASMAAGIPLFACFAFRRKAGPMRTVLFICLGMMVTTLILTGSRSAFVGFVAVLGWVVWGTRHRIAFGVAGIVIILGLFAVMPDQYRDRYMSIAQSTEEGQTGSERVKLWKKGINMFVDRPLTGVGINCFTPANAYYYSVGRRQWIESHSLYVQVASEMGLVGVFAFFSFVVAFLRLNRKTAAQLESDDDPEDWSFERALLQGMFLGYVALFFTGIFGHSLMRDTWYLYAALGLATARVYVRSRPQHAESIRQQLSL